MLDVAELLHTYGTNWLRSRFETVTQEVDNAVTTYVGKVESCSSRENGFLVGVRINDYCVQHYVWPDRFRIGETVEVLRDGEQKYKLVKTGEK